MNRDELLRRYAAGERNFRSADLSDADLRSADLRGADLRDADLRSAYLCGADLRSAYLCGADLRDADLSDAVLRSADLRSAYFCSADLSEADMSHANLSDADISDADLSYAILWGAYLRGANLRGANLRGANLSSADLSGVRGMLNPAEWCRTNLAWDDRGWVVYKTLSEWHPAPPHWDISAGSIITEVVQPLPTVECGCGINVGTLEWVQHSTFGQIWRCIIPIDYLPTIVVPYNTDGKFRCGGLLLVEPIERGVTRKG